MTVTPKTNDIKLGMPLYRAANQAGMTLSHYLETIDPSDKHNDGLDAFERQLKRFGIVAKSIPEKGIWADLVEKFYTADDGEEVPYLFPEYINRVARRALMADDILSEMVAIRTPIDSNAYRALYLQHDEANAKKVRVEQGAEIPRSKITIGDKAITIAKYGRRIDATYEAIRRMRIDMLNLHIEMIMKQAALDRATDAYSVLMLGDGNSNPATNYNKTTLQGGLSTAALAYGGWLKFMLKFFPHKMTHIIGNLDAVVELLTTDAPNIDPLKLIPGLLWGNAQAGGALAQNIVGNYRVVYLPDATANKILGYDKRYALEMVVEIGSDLVETQKLVTSQWSQIVISEVNGFAIVLPAARNTLTLNA